MRSASDLSISVLILYPLILAFGTAFLDKGVSMDFCDWVGKNKY
jgi:hypothetical protein